MHIIETADFEKLFDGLRESGYTIIGPTLRDGAIVFDRISRSADLPRGWTDTHRPSSYALEQTGGKAFFANNIGPVSWKKYLFPPRVKLFAARRTGKTFEITSDGEAEAAAQPRLAFLGIRACELNAIRIQDMIFMEGPYADPTYRAIREQAMVIAVNCTQAGGNCFCASMGTGPRARGRFDLALTEVPEEGRHRFLVEVGSEKGKALLERVPHHEAGKADEELAAAASEAVASSMPKSMNVLNLKEILYENFEHAEWEDVAKRCLACANCTMVCPTCFCSTVEDVTDLAGEHAERWRRWDSCFTMDFTRVAGGNIRPSTRSRYRQWMSHKLGYWVDQFGVLGCVGCGRCITWCPVGIDITAEVQAIRGTNSTQKT